MAEVKTKIAALKSKVIRLEHSSKKTIEPSGSGQDGNLPTGSTCNMASNYNHDKPSENMADLSADDSVNTVDENTPELPVEESLNSLVLTNQLSQLRQ